MIKHYSVLTSFGPTVAITLDLGIEYIIVCVVGKDLVSRVDQMAIIEYVLVFKKC